MMPGKKLFYWTQRLVALALFLLLLAGCETAPAASGSVASDESTSGESISFTDALGYPVQVESWERVVSLYGSFAETWTLAGGSLVGTTQDALEERNMELGEDVALVGSVKQPNLEEILAVSPDFVILSADIAGQADLHEALEQAGITHAYYRIDRFEEYLAMLEQFCKMTSRMDLYEKNGLAVQEEIGRVKELTRDKKGPSVLLLRAFSTGAKAKGEDNLAGVILKELGAENLVEQYDSLLEDIGMEDLIAADPDFIFVVTMGADEEKALAYMAQTFESNPAWSGLTAVREGRYVHLPRALYHFKPNARWGESYAYLAKILYPELEEALEAPVA